MVALSLGHTGQNDDEFYKGVMDEVGYHGYPN